MRLEVPAVTAFEYTDLALRHFQFAGLLAIAFSFVTAIYLAALWSQAGRMKGLPGLLVHTLFYGWQSNVAYLAVVTLQAGRRSLDMALPGEPAASWAWAPWLVPAAAVLYCAVLLLCIAFAVSCVRRG
jgi:hypothetical protein